MALLLYWAPAVLLVLVAIVSLNIMGFFGGGNKFQVEGRTVLLTGASYGMGKEITKMLSERGANIILVARNVEKLQSALEYAKSYAKNPTTQRFHIISADVSVEAENDRLLAEATAWNHGVTPEIVWANAGSSKPRLFLETKIETLREQMDLNYWAAAYLSHKTLKAWLYPETPYEPKEKGGKPEGTRHLIMTSSALAFVNVAGYSPYSAAKAGLRSLCDALRYEVLMYNGARKSTVTTGQTPAPFDINVQCIFPGTITSPGHEQEQRMKHPLTVALEDADPVQSEVEAAAASIKGLENGHPLIATNWLVELIRISTLGGSSRNNIIKDTFGQWVTSIVWLFVLPDMEGKAWNWGKKKGMPTQPEEK